MEVRLAFLFLGICGIIGIVYSYLQRDGTEGYIRACKEQDIGRAWLFTISCFGLLGLSYVL